MATGWRRFHGDHLGLDAHLVVRAHRSQPPELVDADAEDAAGGLEIALDQQAHRRGRGVAAAHDETAKERILGRLSIQMERVRIELVGKSDRARRVEAVARDADDALSDREVLEVALCRPPMLAASCGLR